MKKVIATAKRLWDKYVIHGCHLCLRGVMVRMVDGVLLGIVSILVWMLIHTFWKANITTLDPGLIGSTVQPRRRRTIVLVNTGMAVPSLQRSGQAANGLLHHGIKNIAPCVCVCVFVYSRMTKFQVSHRRRSSSKASSKLRRDLLGSNP
jgi:hypothetical protein